MRAARPSHCASRGSLCSPMSRYARPLLSAAVCSADHKPLAGYKTRILYNCLPRPSRGRGEAGQLRAFRRSRACGTKSAFCMVGAALECRLQQARKRVFIPPRENASPPQGGLAEPFRAAARYTALPLGTAWKTNAKRNKSFRKHPPAPQGEQRLCEG